MKADHPRSMLNAILSHPDDAVARLNELRLIVAERLDETTSARETASLAGSLLAIETAIRAASAESPGTSQVDDLLARRKARGAR